MSFFEPLSPKDKLVNSLAKLCKSTGGMKSTMNNAVNIDGHEVVDNARNEILKVIDNPAHANEIVQGTSSYKP